MPAMEADGCEVHERCGVFHHGTLTRLGSKYLLRRWDWGGCQEGPVIPSEEVRLEPYRVTLFH